MTGASLLAALGGACAGLALAEAWVAAGTSTEVSVPRALRRPRPAGAPSARAAVHHVAPVIVGALVGWALLGTAGFAVGAIGSAGTRRLAATRGARRGVRQRERGVGALSRSLADAVRAGHSVRGAIHAAAGDPAVPNPLRHDLVEMDAALLRGAGLPAALQRLGRSGGPQLVLLSAVVALHAERGGRLPHALDRLADESDRAVRLDEERAAATAQARATVRTVAALPLLALAGAQLLGGDLLSAVAAHPASLALLACGLGLELAAVVIAQRLVADAA